MIEQNRKYIIKLDCALYNLQILYKMPINSNLTANSYFKNNNFNKMDICYHSEETSTNQNYNSYDLNKIIEEPEMTTTF